MVAVVLAALALMSVIAPVSASRSGQAVRIDASSYFDVFPYGGPFTSTGGLICRDGTNQDDPDSFVFINTGSDRYLHIQLDAVFTCQDNAKTNRDEGGTFRIERQIYIDSVAQKEAFTWIVIGGTGAYQGLGGGGAGVTQALTDPVRGDYHIGHFFGILTNGG